MTPNEIEKKGEKFLCLVLSFVAVQLLLRYISKFLFFSVTERKGNMKREHP